MEYWSDDYITSSDSDDEEEEPVEYRDPRDIDYEHLENLLDSRQAPPSIPYVGRIGVVELRVCAVGSKRVDIESVVDATSVASWEHWLHKKVLPRPSQFRFEDWEAMHEFCFHVCECCNVVADESRVRSCMIRLLAHGDFVHRQLDRGGMHRR